MTMILMKTRSDSWSVNRISLKGFLRWVRKISNTNHLMYCVADFLMDYVKQAFRKFKFCSACDFIA